MKNSILQELNGYIKDLINDNVLTDENQQDWQFHAFNEDYYIIGYYESSQWLKRHNIGELEGASICNQYEIDNFGEVQPNKYNNTETIVNMLAYIYGEEIIYQYNTIQELKEATE